MLTSQYYFAIKWFTPGVKSYKYTVCEQGGSGLSYNYHAQFDTTMLTNLEIRQICVNQINQQLIVQTKVEGLVVHKLDGRNYQFSITDRKKTHMTYMYMYSVQCIKHCPNVQQLVHVKVNALTIGVKANIFPLYAYRELVLRTPMFLSTGRPLNFIFLFTPVKGPKYFVSQLLMVKTYL